MFCNYLVITLISLHMHTITQSPCAHESEHYASRPENFEVQPPKPPGSDVYAIIMRVQCQLFCTQRNYCDFVVWMKKDVHIEHIYPDESFWLENVYRVKHFFVTAILPELIGKLYSGTSDSASVPQTPSPNEPSCSIPLSEPGPLSSVPSIETNGDSAKTYCYCQGLEYGDMVGCDNPSCPHEWFHLSCLKLVC